MATPLPAALSVQANSGISPEAVAEQSSERLLNQAVQQRKQDALHLLSLQKDGRQVSVNKHADSAASIYNNQPNRSSGGPGGKMGDGARISFYQRIQMQQHQSSNGFINSQGA